MLTRGMHCTTIENSSGSVGPTMVGSFQASKKRRRSAVANMNGSSNSYRLSRSVVLLVFYTMLSCSSNVSAFAVAPSANRYKAAAVVHGSSGGNGIRDAYSLSALPTSSSTTVSGRKKAKKSSKAKGKKVVKATSKTTTVIESNNNDQTTKPVQSVNKKIPMTRRILMEHEILSKAEEHTMARSIQKFNSVQILLKELIQNKDIERQARLEVERWETVPNDSSDLWYVSSSSFYHVVAENDSEEYDARASEEFSILEDQERNSFVPPEWVRATPKVLERYTLDNDKIANLSDEDVRVALSLPGGKTELYQILIEGATARDRLLRSNFRLVVSIAKRWAKQMSRNTFTDMATMYEGDWTRPSLDEAIQEGILGLSTAVDRFEPKRNLRFSTYATIWVTNSIRRLFQRSSTGCLRVPTAFYDARTKVRRLAKEHYDNYQELPAFAHLSQLTGIKPKRLETMLRNTRPLLSLDSPIHDGAMTRAGKAGSDTDGSDMLLGDSLTDKDDMKPDDRIELSFLRQSLESAMATELAPHERDVVRLRLGLDDGVTRTLKEVVGEFGGTVSLSEVKAAEQRAYQKLRSPHTLSRYKFLAFLDFAGVDKGTVSVNYSY